MRRTHVLWGMFCIGLVLSVLPLGRGTAFGIYAQESAQSQPPAAEGKPTEPKQKATKSVRKPPRGRLPNYYGRIGLSEDQRTTIYGIQGMYETQIEKLEQQIADLESKRDKEIDTVLTDAQRERLAQVTEEAMKRREAARKARAKLTETPSP